jgi:hypothetical protein
MRRHTTTVLALAATGCAALAGMVSPAAGASGSGDAVTFARTTASTQPAGDSTSRVFHIVFSNSRTLFDEIDDGSPTDPNGPNFNGEDTSGIDTPDDYDSSLQEATSSIPADSYGRYNLLFMAGMTGDAASYEQAMSDLELPFMFAGREQWVRNLSGAGVESEPRLWDVTMESVTADDNARMLLLGRAALSADRGLSAAGDLSYWQSLVPSWAPRVRAELAKKGIPFSVELLADADINLTDPSQPLFPKGAAPLSLFGLGVLQRGEATFLRSLSAEDLMLQVWPAYYRFYHRAAGSMVPPDLSAGLTFGSPVRQSDGTYLRSPLMTADSYQRWQAYGYPGVITDVKTSTDLFNAITASPDRFIGQYALYAPSTIDPAVLQRYRTLAEGN